MHGVFLLGTCTIAGTLIAIGTMLCVIVIATIIVCIAAIIVYIAARPEAEASPDSKASPDPVISSAPDDTDKANEIEQCLVLIASITARAEALGLSVSDKLDPIREVLRECADHDDEHSDESATLHDDDTSVISMINSLGHSLNVDIPDEHELENDVLPCLRRIDARLETMSRDAATVRDAVMTLCSLDTQLEQVAVAASAR